MDGEQINATKLTVLPTLGDVATRITDALFKNGYYENGFYPVEDGFAIATHIEQINNDGTSKQTGRWLSQPSSPDTWSLRTYLLSLFKAPKGRFRVIVFVITSRPFETTSEPVTRQQAADWPSSGLNALPENVRRTPFSAAYQCTSLIYEFEATGKKAKLLDPSEIQGWTHLIKSGVMSALTTAK